MLLRTAGPLEAVLAGAGVTNAAPPAAAAPAPAPATAGAVAVAVAVAVAAAGAGEEATEPAVSALRGGATGDGRAAAAEAAEPAGAGVAGAEAVVAAAAAAVVVAFLDLEPLKKMSLPRRSTAATATPAMQRRFFCSVSISVGVVREDTEGATQNPMRWGKTGGV